MNSNPRILIADDQPDVLEALRLLLKGEKFESQSVSSPAGILSALESAEFDMVLIDLNYSRDTTSGRRRTGLRQPDTVARSGTPGRRDDRLGKY